MTTTEAKDEVRELLQAHADFLHDAAEKAQQRVRDYDLLADSEGRCTADALPIHCQVKVCGEWHWFDGLDGFGRLVLRSLEPHAATSYYVPYDGELFTSADVF